MRAFVEVFLEIHHGLYNINKVAQEIVCALCRSVALHTGSNYGSGCGVSGFRVYGLGSFVHAFDIVATCS